MEKLANRLKLSESERRPYAWALVESRFGEVPLQTTLKEIKAATGKHRIDDVAAILRSLAAKGCIEFKKVEAFRDTLVFIRVTDLGKPTVEERAEFGALDEQTNPIDNRNDIVTDEAEARTLLKAQMEAREARDIVIYPWMLDLHLKPLALLYYAYAYSNRNSDNRWYERLIDTCDVFVANDATMALARDACTANGLLRREISQRRPSVSYPYFVASEEEAKKIAENIKKKGE